jgi:hypothetical protein
VQGAGHGRKDLWTLLVEMPGTVLWVSGVKVGEQFVIGQMPQSRRIISHGIELAWQVTVQGCIMMIPLMYGLEAQQEGWNCIGGGQTLSLPGLGCLIISAGVDRPFSHIVIVANCVVLNHRGRQFQVGVGDGAAYICC